MISISQHEIIFPYSTELKDLINLKPEIVNHVQGVIHCKMKNCTGCDGSSCLFFKHIKTTLTEAEDRCYFAPVQIPTKTCGIQYIVLGRYKNPESERIEELIKILNIKIPERVERWDGRIPCEFTSLDINKDTKNIYVVWEVIVFYQIVRVIKEDIFTPASTLQDKRISIIEAIKDFFKF